MQIKWQTKWNLQFGCHGNLFRSQSFSAYKQICDLSRENVPNGSRSNAERNSKRTGDERLSKPFKTGTVNRWTANENFRTDEVKRMNG